MRSPTLRSDALPACPSVGERTDLRRKTVRHWHRTPLTRTRPRNGPQAQVTGKVEYRQGDGANVAIRPGPVEVQTTPTDATLSWADGETHGSAAMPIADFQSYVSKGLIAWRS